MEGRCVLALVPDGAPADASAVELPETGSLGFEGPWVAGDQPGELMESSKVGKRRAGSACVCIAVCGRGWVHVCESA